MSPEDQTPEAAPPGPPFNLQVALTEEHAAEVRACLAGQDRVEVNYRSLGHAQAPLHAPRQRQRMSVGHTWESLRPLEVDSPPPPVIHFPKRWDIERGRFCALRGNRPLHLLRARPNY